MPPKWVVRSVHINIGTGDSAAHYLVDVAPAADGSPRRVVESSVLIDGGHAANGSEAVARFLQGLSGTNVYARRDGLPISAFDTIVVTHWDSDHVDGIVELFARELSAQFDAGITDGRIDPNDIPKLVQEINDGLWRSAYSIYAGTPLRPKTPLFAPYWKPGKSNTKPAPAKTPTTDLDAWQDPANNKWFMRVRVTFAGGLWARVPVAEMPSPEIEYGAKFLGRNLFSPDQAAIPILSQRSPRHISAYLATLPDTAPWMVCVGCDSRICDKTVLSQRTKMKWYARSSFDEVCIASTPPGLGWDELAFPYYEPKDNGTVSTSSIKGNTTGNNQASVACMVIWPNANFGDVSHYLGGDLGDENEDALVRWSMTPNQANNRRSNADMRVRAMKVSHHGKYSMCASLRSRSLTRR